MVAAVPSTTWTRDAPATYFPHGRYRRRIRLVAHATRAPCWAGSRTTSTTSRCACEHDGTHVKTITSESVRAPWTTCPAAGAQLQALVGDAAVRSVPRGRRSHAVRPALHPPARHRVPRGRARGAGRPQAGRHAPPVRRGGAVRAARRPAPHGHAGARRRRAPRLGAARAAAIVAPSPVLGRDRRVRALGRRHLRRRHRRGRHRARSARAASA